MHDDKRCRTAPIQAFFQRDPQRAVRWLAPRLRTSCRQPALYAALEAWECGVFDGGCLMVAAALQRVIGTGTYCALSGTDRISGQYSASQHALLRVGAWYLDGDGAQRESALRHHWFRAELLIVHDIRPVRSLNELRRAMPNTPYEPSAVTAIAAVITDVLRRPRHRAG